MSYAGGTCVRALNERCSMFKQIQIPFIIYIKLNINKLYITRNTYHYVVVAIVKMYYNISTPKTLRR